MYMHAWVGAEVVETASINPCLNLYESSDLFQLWPIHEKKKEKKDFLVLLLPPGFPSIPFSILGFFWAFGPPGLM